MSILSRKVSASFPFFPLKGTGLLICASLGIMVPVAVTWFITPVLSVSFMGFLVSFLPLSSYFLPLSSLLSLLYHGSLSLGSLFGRVVDCLWKDVQVKGILVTNVSSSLGPKSWSLSVWLGVLLVVSFVKSSMI